MPEDATTAAHGVETNRALRILANPAQRRALELVAGAEISSGQLAKRCGWTRPATSQHLRALREARLVDVRVQGNQRLYRGRPEALARLRAFLDEFWAQRLQVLSQEVSGVNSRSERRRRPRAAPK